MSSELRDQCDVTACFFDFVFFCLLFLKWEEAVFYLFFFYEGSVFSFIESSSSASFMQVCSCEEMIWPQNRCGLQPQATPADEMLILKM